MVKSQHQYNQESRDRHSCKKIGIVVRKDDIDRFHAMRRESGLSAPDFFSSLLLGYRLQPEQPEPDTVTTLHDDNVQPDQTGTNTAVATNLTMTGVERNTFALELLNSRPTAVTKTRYAGYTKDQVTTPAPRIQCR